jgi:hypothetical protein
VFSICSIIDFVINILTNINNKSLYYQPLTTKKLIKGQNIDSTWLTCHQPLLTKKTIDQLSTNRLKSGKVAHLDGAKTGTK